MKFFVAVEAYQGDTECYGPFDTENAAIEWGDNKVKEEVAAKKGGYRFSIYPLLPITCQH